MDSTQSVNALGAALLEAGFTRDTQGESYFNGLSRDLGMHDNGDYGVLGHYVKGAVSVTVERTQSPESMGDDSEFMWLRPPVAIIEGGQHGRVTANPADIPLVLALTGEQSTHTL